MNDKIMQFEIHLNEEEKAKNTIDKYLRDINEFYNWFKMQSNRRGEHCEPVVTKDNLLNYKEYLKMSKLKVSTINSKISSLNAYFAYTENESFKLKLLKCQKLLFGNKERELTKYEFNKLYIASKNDERLRFLIETITKTGIRVSEVKYITIEALKKGKAEIYNKGKIRIILIPRKLCIKLLDYHHRDRIKKCIGEFSNCDSKLRNCMGELYEPIFTTRNGSPLDRKHIWQMMKRLADKAGVSKDKIYPHNLRHLFAREFYRETHDIVKLASILGHSSIETTRIYARETEDECRLDIEKLDFVRD